MRRFSDLKVWNRAHAVVREIYRRTRSFPADEKFGLCGQLRRAAVSVPANIAEGCKRPTRDDFARHVGIAEGSASEADYLVLLASELGYIDSVPAQAIRRELDEISKMLGALRLSLKNGRRVAVAPGDTDPPAH